MIEKIADIEKAIESKAYLSAMALALTIPDICGKLEWPNEKRVGVRYANWFDKYITENYTPPGEAPRLTGEMCYKLRCAFLHSGNVQDKVLGNFDLSVDNWDSYELNSAQNVTSAQVSIKRFCFVMCAMAKWFYKENKEHFDFKDSHINLIDTEKRYAAIIERRNHFSDILMSKYEEKS